MRVVSVTFFLILCLNVFSQNIEKSIQILDGDTNLPIDNASVTILKTKQIYISNSEGIVNFILDGNSIIQISHFSYKTVTIRATILKEKITNIVLKSVVTNLEEIIVTRKHPQKILEELVKNSTNKLTVPVRLKVYTREFFKFNGDYTYYNDGLLNFQIQADKNNFKSNILVEQNRSFGLIDKDVSQDLLGYNLNDLMQNYYSFEYLKVLLEKDAKKEFDFVVKLYTVNKDYNLMVVTPSDDSKNAIDDFKIIYDPKKKIILEVSSYLSPTVLSKRNDKTVKGEKNIYKSNFKNIYKSDSSDYYLISSYEEAGLEYFNNKKVKNIEVINTFTVTEFSKSRFTFKENEEFKDKTLLNKNNVILTEYWDVSGLKASKEETEIIERLHYKE